MQSYAGGSLEGLDQLPASELEEIWRGTGRCRLVSAAVLGGGLMSTKVAVLDTAGCLHLLPASSPRARSQEVSLVVLPGLQQPPSPAFQAVYARWHVHVRLVLQMLWRLMSAGLPALMPHWTSGCQERIGAKTLR